MDEWTDERNAISPTISKLVETVVKTHRPIIHTATCFNVMIREQRINLCVRLEITIPAFLIAEAALLVQFGTPARCEVRTR